LLIRLAHSEEPLYERLRELSVAPLVILPIVLLIAWLAGYALAGRALSPIEKMAREAQEITPDKLHSRLRLDDADDELGQLARVFNETLARLEQAFEQLRRFTSDASHELRTPLAMVRSVGEVGLQKDGSRAEYRDMIGSMLEEEAHGGISLHSDVNKGCTFQITLPRADLVAKAPKPPSRVPMAEHA